MIVRVVNLLNLSEQFYTCSPKEAVVAAYAQSKNDWSTWEYEKRYNYLLEETANIFLCGGFCALKENVGLKFQKITEEKNK